MLESASCRSATLADLPGPPWQVSSSVSEVQLCESARVADADADADADFIYQLGVCKQAPNWYITVCNNSLIASASNPLKAPQTRPKQLGNMCNSLIDRCVGLALRAIAELFRDATAVRAKRVGPSRANRRRPYRSDQCGVAT